MHRIVTRTELSPGVVRIEVKAERIARKRKPGQFAIVRLGEGCERIPLSIADVDAERGVITFIIREIGVSTKRICACVPGDEIENIAGPLGQPTEIENFGTVVCIGGGVGIAPLYPITKALHEAGNRVISILGGRDAQQVILLDQMKAVSDEVIVCTDDGSMGMKGVVTAPLKEMLEAGNKPDAVFTIGPAIMMKFVCKMTEPHGVKTIVSLNSLMVDGTGMCGGCRVSIGGESRFVCVDGPEFDGHQVDFEEMLSRMSMYKDYEARAMERYEKKHKCNLDIALEKSIEKDKKSE